MDSPSDARPTVGLVAGWGRFPLLVAEALVRQRYRVVCVAITGHADRALESVCDEVRWMGVARLGGHLRYFRRQGAGAVTMAGKLFKADIMFRRMRFLRHLPDFTCIRTLGPHFITGARDTRDDSLLTAITEAYLTRGMHVCPATDFAPELLVDVGPLNHRRLSAAQRRDVQFGWKIAKQMGRLDIGQSITVKDQTVIAVEAVEGTDRCIERSGELCRRGGFTLVKVAKPEQDMRFDVPTIGPLTVQQVADAGGRAIAIEASKTIVVDRDEVIRLADRRGIAIVAVHDPAELRRESDRAA